jgi:Predicted acyl-CoA transferases/carnitine dehydratase
MKPLEGIKVIELAQVVAAPTVGRVMSDFGADVIKIEPLGGDVLRGAGIAYALPIEEDDNPLFTIMNSGKKLTAVDTKSEEGYAILMALLEDADVFVSNVRMKSLVKMGLDYNTLKERFPRLIYAHFSGYGQTGPDANKPGYDSTAFWLRNGAMMDWKAEDEFLMNPSYAFGDMTTSNAFLSGILMAIIGRESTGEGTFVTTSLEASGIWCNMCDIISSQPQYGRKFEYDQFHQTDPFCAIYKCSDGRYIGFYDNDYIAEKEKFARLFEMEDIIDDERYETTTTLFKTNAIAEAIERMNAIMEKKTSAEWEKIFEENNISYEIAMHASEVSTDPQAEANGYLEEVEFPNGDRPKIPVPPVKYDKYDRKKTTPAGGIGADTDAVMAELGYTAEQIADLKSRAVIK